MALATGGLGSSFVFRLQGRHPKTIPFFRVVARSRPRRIRGVGKREGERELGEKIETVPSSQAWSKQAAKSNHVEFCLLKHYMVYSAKKGIIKRRTECIYRLDSVRRVMVLYTAQRRTEVERWAGGPKTNTGAMDQGRPRRKNDDVQKHYTLY